jgi:hypothetical protein
LLSSAAAETTFVLVSDSSSRCCTVVNLTDRSPTALDDGLRSRGASIATTASSGKRNSTEAVNGALEKIKRRVCDAGSSKAHASSAIILEVIKEKQRKQEEHNQQVFQMLAAIQANLALKNPPPEATAQPEEQREVPTGSQTAPTSAAKTSIDKSHLLTMRRRQGQQRLRHSNVAEGTASSKEKGSTSRTRTGQAYSANSPRKKSRTRTPKSTEHAEGQQEDASPVQHHTGKRSLPTSDPVAPFNVVLAGDVITYYMETMGVLHGGLSLPTSIVKEVWEENFARNHVVVETMDGAFLPPTQSLRILARPPKGYKGNYVSNPKPFLYTMDVLTFSNRRNKEVAAMIRKGTRPELKTNDIAKSFLKSLQKDVDQAISDSARRKKKDSV